MATKLFAVVFTVLLTSCKGQDQESICSEFQDNCSPKEKLCLIECKIDDETGDATPCVPNPDAGNCPTFLFRAAPTYTAMNAEFCKQTCVNDTDNGCAFYRYELIEPLKNKKCYLMDRDQCADSGDGCETNCESGAANCDGGHVVEAEDYTCPSGTPHTPQTIPNFNLHWNCRDVNNNNAEFDITQNHTSAPGNTVCTAKPDCKDLHYTYKCVSANETDPTETEGKWQWDRMDGMDDPKLVEEEGDNIGKLKEATCNADPLTVNDYSNQITSGMEILCVDEPINATSGVVPAQNSCILICDGYPILNFYTKMASWVYTYMDSPNVPNTIDDVNQTGDIIYCHKP